MTETDPRPSPLADAVAAVWSRYRNATLQRVAALEDAAASLLAGELSPEQRRAAEREAHKVAGSVGTFGFPVASRVARSVELLLEGDAPFQGTDALRLSDWVVALRAELEGSPASVPAAGDGGPSLLLVTPDDELAERVEMEAAGRGFSVERLLDVDAARRRLSERATSAIVLDVGDPADSAEPLGLVDGTGPGPPPPVVVLGRRDTFAERVAAVRRGARAYLARPVSPADLMDAVEGALLHGAGAGARVLAVDDDPQVLGLLGELLGARRMELHALGDPTRFWHELDLATPDLVILDVDMPGLDGIDLCRSLRSDPRRSALPVLFLTARTDAASVQAIFEAGADDYVTKPVVGPELLGRIENRLERARLAGSGDAAGRGGLPRRTRAAEEITRLIQLAHRAGRCVALARLDVNGLRDLEARLGAAAADEVLTRLAILLQARLAPGDVAGWWSDDEFAVAFFDTDGTAAARWLANLLADIRSEPIPTERGELRLGFCAGIACFPQDGGDLPGLAAAAGQALFAAKEGGKCVVPYLVGQTSGALEAVDVAIVEDDPAVASLLLHALTVQGYATLHLPDGEEAIARLTGRDRSVVARVVLLDVDLPGRDGLAVLREMARSGVLERTRVVMLTVRATEPEVLAALEAGASDHVAKPFSVPVLLQRVRALLQRG